MRDERLRAITLEDIHGGQRELAELVGLETYIKMVDYYRGAYIYIVKPGTLLKKDRDSAIKQEFDGVNYKELAQKYDLTERYIRQIVYEELRQTRRKKRSPMDGQLDFSEGFFELF